VIGRVDWSRPTVWGLYLVAAGMPFYVVRWHIGPLPTTLLEVLVLATCVAYVARLRQMRRLWLRRTPLDIPVALLLIAGVISIVVAFSPIAAAGIYRAYFTSRSTCSRSPLTCGACCWPPASRQPCSHWAR
jgi:hypothetical protein